jgi:hypothetical protein
VWNGLPGLTRLSGFTERRNAVTRIWKAVPNPNQTYNTPRGGNRMPEQLPGDAGKFEPCMP